MLLIQNIMKVDERQVGETSPDQRKYRYWNKQQEKAALNVPETSKVSSRVLGTQARSLHFPALCAAASPPPGATSVPIHPLLPWDLERAKEKREEPTSLPLTPSSSPYVSEEESVSCINCKPSLRLPPDTVTLHCFLFRLVAKYHSLALCLFFKL